MAFFRSVSLAESGPAVAGNGVILRPPEMSDFAEWAALREESRDFLTPWEPIWPADDLTRGAFRRRLKRYAEDQRTDPAYAFLIFREQTTRWSAASRSPISAAASRRPAASATGSASVSRARAT